MSNNQPNNQMVINYVPGEECRVAIVEDGKLEELHTERFATASRVGNIYRGTVNNVEPAIQAAFVDFGIGENGFLHVSDLHPRYFPGEDEETTERVGHKTPRRERPPIQQALKRGDEVIVQVIKEGVGTKGPTLTSYLSIPGRFLVMMPQMDKVGVSRKVEDEDLRRKMREILDQLDLPDGFGFILRTAGMDRGKAELKRDLAYLLRLWKDIERRLEGPKARGKNATEAARLLYAESDLLVRCLRDLLTAETAEVVIDHELAVQRAAKFMKIVAPRAQTKLLHYPSRTPIFHAFGIERQIAMIHAREVPLPSGGRLVIDQTEALVAIDVNSGKSRETRDAEENAYRTNLQAVDEICRQLRLRDLGGIVINDLIDMRDASHRKDVEARFKERLKRDRARTTTEAISAFGILEMTRQRMRGSHESVHFADCPTCRGRGLVQKPDSVAAESLRDLAALLEMNNVARVEMVVSPRVAGELLSAKRRALSRIEHTSGKHVDVRVSEAVPPDRVGFYAYDPNGADIDLTNLPQPKKPKELVAWEEPAAAEESDEGWSSDAVQEHRDAQSSQTTQEATGETSEASPLHPIEMDIPDMDEEAIDEVIQNAASGSGGGGGGANGERGEGGRRRRRRRGRGRGGRDGREGGGERSSQRPAERPAASEETGSTPAAASVNGILYGDHGEDGASAPQDASEDHETQGQAEPSAGGEARSPEEAPGEGGRRRRRRRRGRGGRGRGGEQGGPGPREGEGAHTGEHAPESPRPEGQSEQGGPDGHDGTGENGEPRRRRRRRRGRGGRGRGGEQGGPGPREGAASSGQPPAPQAAPRPAPAAPKPPAAPGVRVLYSNRRRLNPSELNKRPKPE